MTTRQLRLLRAASASAVATLLAAVSHTVAGGAAPHPLLILAVAVLLVPVAAGLIGIRHSRTRVAATVLVSQVAFHAVFQALGAPTAGAPVLGHTHHLDLGSLGPATPAAAPDLAMLAAHVLAAVGTTAVLWHGESAIRLIAAWMLARLRRDVTPAPASHRRPAAPLSLAPVALDDLLPLPVSRRGPPQHT
ncbi:hypothetical protein [Microbacterium sp. 1.5R]|uniref:hypothetical protein n=1 Tax=Microbacterium sp. 1.5R TaxID=1916917 RepID=UPI0011A3424A|nr:hypothetical protein [Microbacterium sp. 1.5R]